MRIRYKATSGLYEYCDCQMVNIRCMYISQQQIHIQIPLVGLLFRVNYGPEWDEIHL